MEYLINVSHLFPVSSSQLNVFTMLRLHFSRISLERKDLDFHLKTHQRRQTALGHSHSLVDANEPFSESPRSIQRKKSSSVQSPVKKLAVLPATLPAHEPHEENPIISREPVPRGSKAFWDKVLAEAGTPTRTKSTGSGNGKIIDLPDEWLENHRSAAASIEEDRNAAIDYGDYQTSSDDAQDVTILPHYQSLLDSTHPTNGNILDDVGRRKGFTASLESIRHFTKQSRLSNLFRRRPRSFDTVEKIHQQTNPDLGLDGYRSDMQQYREEYSTSSGTSQAPTIIDGLYGSKHDRRTISSSIETSVVRESEKSQPASAEQVQRYYGVSPDTVFSMPTYPRRPSTSIVQAPLDAWEVAASTSPKMSPVVSSEPRIRLLGGFSNPLSVPPRRPRTYRPRSETYSYELSEASNAPCQVNGIPSPSVDLDLLEQVPPNNVIKPSVSEAKSFSSKSSLIRSDDPSYTSHIPQPKELILRQHRAHSTSASHIEQSRPSVSPAATYLSNSPAKVRRAPRTPTEMENYQIIGHESSLSNASSPFASSHSSLSPFALPFVPLTTPTRNLTPQYQLPLPFGATPRTVSYSHAMPASSSPLTPLNMSSGHQFHSSPHASFMPEPIPATPPRSSFRVYNDSEIPQTQPQTAADLHRRRRLYFHNTAPARGPLPIEHGIARWQAFASQPRSGRTPTRLRPEHHPVRMESMVSADVENGDSITTEERERRRAWNGGLRMSQEERRVLDLSPGVLGRHVS